MYSCSNVTEDTLLLVMYIVRLKGNFILNYNCMYIDWRQCRDVFVIQGSVSIRVLFIRIIGTVVCG